MALKETTFKLTDGGVEKTFKVTRMSAMKADRWARHLVKALTRAGIALPKEALDLGMAGLGGIAQSLYGQLDNDATEEAITALRQTVTIMRDPSNPAATSAITEYDIEDHGTLQRIDQEAFRMHVGFFKAGALFISPLVEMLAPARNDESQPAA